jgi:hypothetical protein
MKGDNEDEIKKNFFKDENIVHALGIWRRNLEPEFREYIFIITIYQK